MCFKTVPRLEKTNMSPFIFLDKEMICSWRPAMGSSPPSTAAVTIAVRAGLLPAGNLQQDPGCTEGVVGRANRPSSEILATPCAPHLSCMLFCLEWFWKMVECLGHGGMSPWETVTQQAPSVQPEVEQLRWQPDEPQLRPKSSVGRTELSELG